MSEYLNVYWDTDTKTYLKLIPYLLIRYGKTAPTPRDYNVGNGNQILWCDIVSKFMNSFWKTIQTKKNHMKKRRMTTITGTYLRTLDTKQIFLPFKNKWQFGLWFWDRVCIWMKVKCYFKMWIRTFSILFRRSNHHYDRSELLITDWHNK